MAITPPVAGQQISATSWGIPITDEVNRLTPLVNRQEAPYTCRVFRTAAYSIGSGAVVQFPFDTEDNDPFNMWSSANPERITIPADGGGIYLIVAQISWSPNNTGDRMLCIGANGNTDYRISKQETQAHSVSASFEIGQSCSAILKLAGGNWVTMLVYQSTAAGLAVVTHTHPWASPCNLAVIRLGTGTV